jgi:hypothetical protein
MTDNDKGKFRTEKKETHQLRADLQEGDSDSLRCRRLIINLSLLGIGAMAAATLFQTGIVKHLPVPPIYQPEVGAEAVYFVAHNDRREMYVGYPTVEAIVGNKIVPGYADKYLAKGGYKSQQTDEPVEADRQNNLYEPVAGDHGAHGSFDERAKDFSPQLWANKNRGKVALSALGVAAGLALLWKRSRD